MPGCDASADLVRRADEAVLASKRAGGDQITVASDNSLKQRFRSDIALHLQGDIDSDALMLRYLPEVDLWTGAIVAAEALVRWRHPTRGCYCRTRSSGWPNRWISLPNWTGGCCEPRARSSVGGARAAWDEARRCGSIFHLCN